LRVKGAGGDIYTPEFMRALKGATDDVFFIPGVDRATVTSLFTPNVRFVEVVEDGFAGGNVVPASFKARRPISKPCARTCSSRATSGGWWRTTSAAP